MKKTTATIRWGIALITLSTLAVTTSASARATFVDLAVSEAKTSRMSGNLLDVPFYMAGEKHPGVARDLGEFTSNRSTNAFNKSDRDACHIAFLSAIIALQKRANDMGGDAIVDVRSVTRHNDLSSATEYRCVAGNVVATVALTGRVVKLGGKK